MEGAEEEEEQGRGMLTSTPGEEHEGVSKCVCVCVSMSVYVDVTSKLFNIEKTLAGVDRSLSVCVRVFAYLHVCVF